MELRQLSYFISVVEHKSFSEAARKLYVSHSALSKAVKKLEEEMGVQLLYQREKRTLPTAAGALLYERARQILDTAASTAELVSGAEGSVRGYLRVASSIRLNFGSRLCDCVARFLAEYPDVFIDLDQSMPGQIKDGLLRRQFDVGLLLDPTTIITGASFEVSVIDQGPCRVLMHKDHPLAQRESLDFSDLSGESWGLMQGGFYGSRLVVACCEEAGYTPQAAVSTTDPQLLLAMAERGQCICVLPWPDWLAESLQRDSLAAVPLRTELGTYELRALTLKDAYLSPVAKTFVRYLAEHY